MVEEIKAGEFIKVVNSGRPAMIKFYSQNCKFCAKLSKVYDKLSHEFENLNFYKIGIDSHPESTLPHMLMFNGVPSILLLNGDGRRKYRFINEPKKPNQNTWYTKSHIKQFLKKNFKEIK